MENGTPLQGTWTRAFEEVELSSVHRPYPFPLPGRIKDSRIKEWESFIIQDDRFYLQARLSNLKYFRSAQVIVHDRETKERLEFRKLLPGGGWRLPKGLYNASVDSRSMGFFFRIHSWLDAETIKLELNIERTRLRPAFTAHVTFDLAAVKTTPMAVSLKFSERRNMYAYKALSPVRGDIVSGGRHIYLDPAKTTGLFCDFKGYYPYRMRSSWCTGMDFDSRGRRFGFTLGENQAKEPFKNNENALWIDGRLTPLPPVKITRYLPVKQRGEVFAGGDLPLRDSGNTADWIIQDMEGMVDLVFTPREPGRTTRNFIFSRFDSENSLGCFNGLVVSAEGEEIPVRNVWGTGEKLYLRV